jgi:uncharacterized protein
MFDLPLFPLNAVLFPGTPLHLHIFEERYKRMINLCIEKRQPFGVVLIQSGVEALAELAEPYEIGCTAHLIHIQRLEQDQMNLVALGQERFVIRSLDRVSEPYLVGKVETKPVSMRTYPDLLASGERLRRKVENYIQILLTAGGSFDSRQLPEHPVELAYAAAGLLQIAAAHKQALLELDQPEQLLEEVLAIYAREQALLKAMLAHGETNRSNNSEFSGFSDN